MSAPTAIPLSWEERAATGFTHKFTITHTNLDSVWTSGTAYPIITLPAGQGVQSAGFRVVTNFSGAGIELTIKVGDGVDDDRYIAAKSIHADATYFTHWLSPVTTMPYVYTTSDTVDVILTCTGGTLAALTAGEINVFLNIVDLNKL